MRFLITILLVLPFLAMGQLNIRSFGARESIADNSPFIQRAIDSAIRSGKSVYIPKGRFRVAKPLVVARWGTVAYWQVFIKIYGESTMWDRNNMSVLEATFGDAPLLSIQLGKGCIIQGVNFIGKWKAPGSPYMRDFDTYKDPATRDETYSPYCAIAIDPFCYQLPPDGGYPPLKSYYRGEPQRSGSTGIIVKDCAFRGFTVGAITSPNGFTQNAELITFENIQIQDCKVGFAGCQDQEKMNRIINVGAWGTTHTVFAFNKYGASTPGNWIIDGVNVAGDVYQILHRVSSGYFPLFMTHIYAESVFQFGTWQSYVGDALSNFVLDFSYPEEHGALPIAHFQGGGVTLNNGVIRTYGTDNPVVFMGGKDWEGQDYQLHNVSTTESLGRPNQVVQGYLYGIPQGFKESDFANYDVKDGQIIGGKDGRLAVFLDPANTLKGYAMMESKKIKHKSFTLQDGVYKIAFR